MELLKKLAYFISMEKLKTLKQSLESKIADSKQKFNQAEDVSEKLLWDCRISALKETLKEVEELIG